MTLRPKIALYEPDIPQNTAAIIRTCACLGADLEIIEPCGFLFNDKRFNKIETLGKDWPVNSFKKFVLFSLEIVGLEINSFKSSDSSKIVINEFISSNITSRLPSSIEWLTNAFAYLLEEVPRAIIIGQIFSLLIVCQYILDDFYHHQALALKL